MKAFVLAAMMMASTSALAQTYIAPGGDPVRGHTYLGDAPIDYAHGGTICYRTREGLVCRPANTFRPLRPIHPLRPIPRHHRR